MLNALIMEKDVCTWMCQCPLKTVDSDLNNSDLNRNHVTQ